MPLIPALGRQRGRWISEFEVSLGNTEKPCLKKQNKTKQNKQTKKNKGPRKFTKYRE